MKIKFILPALEEAVSPFWRPIKYALFPPLGLATLAAFCAPEDEVSLWDEHVERVDAEDRPDLAVIETYITNAHRAYELADRYRQRGVYVALGGLHATSLPREAARHADSVLTGLGEGTFPAFLADLRRGEAQPLYRAGQVCLARAPLPRRDLIKREKYLVPNSMLISRGCPNVCDFCYVDSFFRGGRRFYTYPLERVLREMDSLPGKHLYFLDDNLFADRLLSEALFREMRGMGRLFQGAMTVRDAQDERLVRLAHDAGLRSAFIGFESTNRLSLAAAGKRANLDQDYARAIRNLDAAGVMINGSFIFGMDEDTSDTFRATADWAVGQGIATATFHILTPYPGTALYERYRPRMRVHDWRRYDTRHLVFEHPTMTAEQVESGYWEAYRRFYKLRSICEGARHHASAALRRKHLLYSTAWKKLDPLWNAVIRSGLLGQARKVLERTLR